MIAPCAVSTLVQLPGTCTEQREKSSALILVIERQEVIPVSMEKDLMIQTDNYCRRCGRKLKSEKSKEVGMGEVCLKKFKEEHSSRKKLFPSLSLQTKSDIV